MSKSAIILFANLPEFEARAKSFSGFTALKATQKLSGILTKHFYNLAKKTTAQVFLIDTYQQKGKTFGERISNAFADVYAESFDHVVCIGNDCPALTLNQLENAINQTEKGKVVLGPTSDGGAYLIGIPKSYFNSATFSKVSWQSSKTYLDLKAIFANVNDSLVETDLLNDIDGEKDIRNYSNQNPLIKLLLQTLKSFKTAFNTVLYCMKADILFISSLSLKGPPLFG
ncbi:TIGR04282 family arsenosugar biosynthesis glycosyltransferase [Pedobacter cryophilus]|uniref:DUF2064 domain-containing protein n=1 Tax=Pedobacter cryophilus TaxID=2571271 RepID=A0A4U1BVA4_9SPHI|nr:DUF2064 domain-containing protein [Pedobacter cryophilus]TKB96695.1 DUF2064 domain-containing protein [Pedobacter cryophilus]